MRKPPPLLPDRVRHIRQCTFGWVDHNFLHRGFLLRLSQEELLLYYFLLTVADKSGVSFYDYERICQFLKMEVDDYVRARNRLRERSLLAYHEGVFQVLSLPPQQLAPLKSSGVRPPSEGDFQALKEVFKRLVDEQ